MSPPKKNIDLDKRFGAWTGKTPLTLLNETCAKQGWKYNITTTKNKAFKSDIAIFQGKKTLKYSHSHSAAQDAQDARHFAATFALFQIAGHLSMRNLLPPDHSAYWKELQNTSLNEIPSATSSGSLSLDGSRGSLSNHSGKSPLPSIYLDHETRSEIEALIRGMGVYNMLDVKLGNKWKQMLVNYGFRKSHVEEAANYTTDLQDAIQWLCIHVPEDDLPPKYLPPVSKKITIQSHDTVSLRYSLILKRLIKTGLSHDLCERALEIGEGDEIYAFTYITQIAFTSITGNQAFMENGKGSLAQEIDAEKEALEVIYPDSLKHNVGKTGHLVSITLPWNGQTIVNFYFSLASKYPFEIPGLSLDNDKLPAYIKLAIYKELLKEFTHGFGLPMMFSITSWILENGDQVIANPPSLVSLHETVASVNQNSSKRMNVQKTKIQKPFKSLPWDKDTIMNIRVSDKFKEMLAKRRKLPSYDFKKEILDSILKNQIIIICGETGCGKSTQTGQFILETCFETNSPCNIICTQPRRLSATSLAKRVSDEQCQEVGKLVGYRIRGESRSSPETKLTFVTTGILLRMIQFNSLIPEVTHIIFDEVHERTLDGDFLMILLKHLAKNRKDIKVILMSATINSGDFSTYFNAPIINIPGFTYPVKDQYLEDYLQELGFSETDYFKTRSNKSRLDDEGEDDSYAGDSHISNYLKAVNKGLESINYTLIAKLVKYICSSKDDSGAILIFLPGEAEISKCVTEIENQDIDRILLLRLHSSLSSVAQSQIFKEPPTGIRKVVVATNIAETSITIDDVIYVIDSGKLKELRYKNDILALTETWASKANCKQRRGRAGRVKEGVCYKLFTRNFEKKHMQNQQTPEILRTPLHQLCLSIKASGFGDIKSFLSESLDAPDTSEIESALNYLKQVNAFDHQSEELTALGRSMSVFPMDVRLSKLLIYGAVLGCLDPVLTIAACLNGRPVFLNPREKREEAKEYFHISYIRKQKRFAFMQSDLLASYQAYTEWSKLAKRRDRMSFCEDHFLSFGALGEVEDNRRQYIGLLQEIGYIENEYAVSLNQNAQDFRVVKGAIVAGLYPNIAKIKSPPQKYIKTANGALAVDAEPSELKFYDLVERVFLHPASFNFECGKFSDSFLAYFSKIQTSKVYLRDSTCISAWPIVLFGGKMESDHNHNIITLDKSIKIQAFPRISALINALRKLLDEELDLKMEDPSRNVLESSIGKILVRILRSEGL